MLPRRPVPWVLLSLAGLLVSAEAAAIDRPTHLRTTSGLELPHGRVASDVRDLTWRAGPVAAGRARALTRMRAELGRLWIGWDDARAVPRRIVLEGLATPGVIASADRAAEVAREVLARHVALLAPGARADDFVLVGNHVGAGIRSVGFVQTSGGRRVEGGALSFRFKHDRLVAIASDAWPDVPAAATGPRLGEVEARIQARGWLDRDLAAHRTDDLDAAEVVVLPVVIDGVTSYREVVRVRLDTHAPRGRWSVYVDARTGEPVARRQELAFAQGGVAYNAPVRGPNAERIDYGAPFVGVVVDGAATITDGLGAFPFVIGATVASTTPIGTFVAVSDAAGPVGIAEFVPQDGSAFRWDAREDEFLDAQLAAYVHASLVKQYVRGIATDLPWLDTQIPVTVNIDDECNAFSDGNSINFYRASENCENTGRIADVVYHEFGHSVHTQSLIPGVGAFNTSLSEGASDYLSATIVNDSGVGRGFFYDDTPLREIDPADKEYRWPDDKGEVHDEGRIIGGALWDLRKLLVAKHGAATGVQIADRIWYESTRRAVDIPSMYVEALVVDDDDGNLANGTPNACEINAAYGPHGLFSLAEGSANVQASAAAGQAQIALELALPSFPDCPVDAAPTLSWQVRDRPELGAGELEMQRQDGGWIATIDGLQDGTVLQYQVHANYTNGTLGALPDNPVDPWYELYVGDVVPLYCTGFEDLGVGWSTAGDFTFGAPAGGGPDPASGTDSVEVLANALAGTYSPLESAIATSPPVATAGYTNVRLQYRRWLTIEDAFFDQAAILVDDEPVWGNFASEDSEVATMHHIDREWRFHDIDITAFAGDGQVQVAFTLASDGGLELGGWTIDEFCVVAGNASGGALCGNGVLDAGEACDDGNLQPGDGCDAVCGVEGEDDGVPSEDDGGIEESGSGDDAGQDDDGLVGRGCGCATDVGASPWAALTGWFVFGCSVRRRRR